MNARTNKPLRDDPALAEVLGTWRHQGRLSNEAVREMRRHRRRVAGGVAGGALAVVMAFGLATYRSPAPAIQVAHVETARGQDRAVRLPDGTTIRLNGATRLDIRYTPNSRSVTLAAGEAYFDVTHDEDRPFEVSAGDANVRVLGTAFDVNRLGGRTDLSVYRGAVRLAGRDDDRGQRVSAGWRGHVIGGHASAPLRFDPAQEDWRRDWLDTDDMRLADLVEALNRRAGPLVLPPPASLADISVSGRFRLDDPKELLAAIGSAYGFRVEHRGDTLALSQN